MPKKTKYLSDYFVTAPGVNPELAIIKADEAVRANENRHVDIVLGRQSYQEPFLEQYWIKCPVYFKDISPIQKPFKVAKHEFDRNRIHHVCDENDMEDIQKALNEESPYKWPDFYGYLFGPYLWTISESESFLGQEELRLLFLETTDKERRKFERLKNKFSGVAGQKIDGKREPISEEVRIFVWRRDEGKCVKCGSQENLEFDHIIPIAKGGGNTTRNIQILCEKCNREKSANI